MEPFSSLGGGKARPGLKTLCGGSQEARRKTMLVKDTGTVLINGNIRTVKWRVDQKRLSKLESLYWRTYDRLGKYWTDDVKDISELSPYAITLSFRMNTIRKIVEFMLIKFVIEKFSSPEFRHKVVVEVRGREYMLLRDKYGVSFLNWPNEEVIHITID